MAKTSAGLLMYYIENGKPKVFLGHVGGPYGRGKDDGMWGIPKGEVDNGKDGDGEDDGDKLLKVALREFNEETGMTINSNSKFVDLGSVKKKDGKTVYVWAFSGKGNEKYIQGNMMEMEWPPKSGKMERFPEIDKAKYFSIEEARRKIHPYQKPLLDKLISLLKKDLKEEKQSGLF